MKLGTDVLIASLVHMAKKSTRNNRNELLGLAKRIGVRAGRDVRIAREQALQVLGIAPSVFPTDVWPDKQTLPTHSKAMEAVQGAVELLNVAYGEDAMYTSPAHRMLAIGRLRESLLRLLMIEQQKVVDNREQVLMMIATGSHDDPAKRMPQHTEAPRTENEVPTTTES